MDADFSHQPKYLPKLLNALLDADIVLGCRYMPGGGVEGWAQHRQWLSKAGNFYAKRLLNLEYRDLTGGFKCFRRTALERLDLARVQSTGYSFQVEVTHQAHHKGLRIKEVPIVFLEREEGVSKMNLGICWEAITGMWTLRKKNIP
jgi:dolichol-phosphate mannosyltransferase